MQANIQTQKSDADPSEDPGVAAPSQNSGGDVPTPRPDSGTRAGALAGADAIPKNSRPAQRMKMQAPKPDFKKKKLNFIQIGLGTNCTFVHNLAGDESDYNNALAFFFEPSTEKELEHVLGISVEPVARLVENIRPIASRMPGVQLVQAAMGECDQSGAEMKGLSEELRESIVKQAPPNKQHQLIRDLEYLRNMSCLDSVHPFFPRCLNQIESDYGIKFDIECIETVDVWSWEKLVMEYNFVGCEVMLLDAEGCDTKILRSLISFCHDHPDHWPDMIQFETMGHCDSIEGFGAEKATLDSLEREGYTHVAVSDHNSYVMRTSLLEKERRFQDWIYKWRCQTCYTKWCLPYLSNHMGTYCKTCFDELVANGECFSLKILGGFQPDDLNDFITAWNIDRCAAWKLRQQPVEVQRHIASLDFARAHNVSAVVVSLCSEDCSSGDGKEHGEYDQRIWDGSGGWAEQEGWTERGWTEQHWTKNGWHRDEDAMTWQSRGKTKYHSITLSRTWRQSVTAAKQSSEIEKIDNSVTAAKQSRATGSRGVIKEPLPAGFVQKIDTSVTAAKQSRAAGSRGVISEGQNRLETKDRQDRLETGDRRTERQDLLHDA